MASPTTKNGGDWEEPYGRAVAQIIATLARQDGDTVARADIRQAWYSRFPHQDRSTAANKGRLGRPRMNAGIRYLAQRGVIERDPETVRVLHGAKLVEIATSDSGLSHDRGSFDRPVHATQCGSGPRPLAGA